MDITFIKENYLNIIIFVLIFIGFLVLIDIKDWNFSHSEPVLTQEVIMETMENRQVDKNDVLKELKLTSNDSFCESFIHDSSANDLEGACQKLTKKNCLQTSCCVYYQDKCAAGSEDGPTFKTDKDRNSFNIDYYYYQNKCYGNCMK